MPFINEMRKTIHDFDVEAGATIPEELTAVSWCDGDMSQVASIANDHALLPENKIIANKQNAARTGVEQAADLTKVFPAFHNGSDTMTLSEVDASYHPMKKLITKMFKEKLKDLNLPERKCKALIDFLSNLPAIATKATTRNNILHGFVENGTIDKKSQRYPVLSMILGQCRSSIPKETLELVVNNFTYLYNTMMEHGRIPEEVFDELGFPPDRDVNGEVVLRNAGISQESYQRSKILTHKHQVQLRRDRLEEIKAVQRRHLERKLQKQDAKTNELRRVEEKLLNMIADSDDVIDRHLEMCTVEMFNVLNKDELKVFIEARVPDGTLIKNLPKNKGKMRRMQLKMVCHAWTKTIAYIQLTSYDAILSKKLLQLSKKIRVVPVTK